MVTFCSNDATNTHVQLYFSYSDIMPSDTIYIYDGPSTSSPLIGAWNNSSVHLLNLIPVDASIYNSSGCLTVRFHSDGSMEGTGWAATINCHPLCQDVYANLDIANTVPTPDTNYIAICPGTPITFAGNATYGQNDFVYHQSDATSTFTWYFGDGTSAIGPVVNHQYAEAGGYSVTMIATDSHGCASRNSIGTRVVIAGNPFNTISPPAPVCAHDTTQLEFSFNDAGSTIGGTPYHVDIDASLGVTDTTYLPDGTGATYTTSVTFNCFAPGQTLHNAWDVVAVWANIEHSFLGDLQIAIECPNGQTIVLKEYPGGGGVYLGEPIDLDDGVPGVGYDYGWSPSPTFGTMVDEAVSVTTLPTGIYAPYQSFADLVGCPLNGEWSIHITDNWAIDDGFIFAWELQLNPAISPNNWSYTVPIANMSWTDGPFIQSQTDSTINVLPTQSGVFDYTYTIVDAVGCVWDTTVALTVQPAPLVDLGPDMVLCNQAVNMTLDAGNPGYNYTWNDNSHAQTLDVNNSGVYSVTVTNGICSDIDTVSLGVGQITVGSILNHISCYGLSDGSINLTVNSTNPPNVFSWSNGATTEDLNNIPAGTYTVNIQDANNCTVQKTYDITQPTQVVLTTTPNQQICVNQDITLTANAAGGSGGYNYVWSTGALSNSIQVSPVTTTTYTVSVTDATNCSGSPVNIIVSLFDSLHLTAQSLDYTICAGDPATITTQSTGGHGAYTITLNNLNVISSPYTFYPHSSQTIELCLTDECTTPKVCQEISFQVKPLPVVMFQADKIAGCEPLSIHYTAWGSNNITNFTWNFGDELNYSTAQNPSHTYNNDGIFDVSVSVVDSNGCANNLSYASYITVYPKPISHFTTDPLTASILNPIIAFKNLSELNVHNYWSFGDGDSSVLVNPVHTYNAPGTYNILLVAETDHGCRDTSNYKVMIRDEFTFFAPTAISVDKNGTNDVFYITGTNISPEGFQLLIYDRWGEIVYQTDKYYPENPAKNGWDGKLSGKPVTVGTYTWLAKFKDMTGVHHEKVGAVTIIK